MHSRRGFFSRKKLHLFASGKPPWDRSRRDMQNDCEIMQFAPLGTHFGTIFDFPEASTLRSPHLESSTLRSPHSQKPTLAQVHVVIGSIVLLLFFLLRLLVFPLPSYFSKVVHPKIPKNIINWSKFPLNFLRNCPPYFFKTVRPILLKQILAQNKESIRNRWRTTGDQGKHYQKCLRRL